MTDIEHLFAVYRIVDYTPPGPGPYTWMIQERKIKRVSDRRIELDRPFSGINRTRFERTVLGLYFFRSPAAAVRDFAAKQRRNIEAAERAIRAAEEALTWAERWAAEHPEQPKIAEAP